MRERKNRVQALLVKVFLTILLLSAVVYPSFAQESAGTGGLDLKSLGIGIGIGLSVIGAGIGQGWIGAKAMESIGRNPESSDKLFMPMIVALAFVEALVLYIFVLALKSYLLH